ncbi:MAG TPA: CAP domain-containing protein [Chloroflexaceae bacterium]|nr:CAP domain-containing protein [Chloroflexaceae bacterium]
MRRILALIALIVVGSLALVTLTPGGALAQTSEPTALYKSYLPMIAGPARTQSPAEDAIASQILSLVNSERAKAGCAPVTLDARLMSAAQGHSEDMALNDYFSHTSLDGTTASQRVTRAGYDWSTTGENIAAGYGSAAQVMEGWMQSDGHRANILRCAYTNLGVGHYYEAGDSYGHYWTQVFARP